MLLLLKSIEERILLPSVFFILHHDDLVSNSTELNGVPELKLVSFFGLIIDFLVSLHVSQNHPELVSGISLLLFRVLNGLSMEYPKVIVFEEAGGHYSLVILFLKFGQNCLISSHFLKVFEFFSDDVFIISF